MFPSELCAQKFLLRVVSREEQLDVEMLVAQAAIEALDERIVYGLPGPRELKADPWSYAPAVGAQRIELRAVIHRDHRRRRRRGRAPQLRARVRGW